MRLPQGLIELVLVELADLPHDLQVELAPHDRGQREDLAAPLRLATKPQSDRLSHALRHREALGRPSRLEQPPDLGREERVALGLGLHLLCEVP